MEALLERADVSGSKAIPESNDWFLPKSLAFGCCSDWTQSQPLVDDVTLRSLWLSAAAPQALVAK
jgi:hypothetical protein